MQRRLIKYSQGYYFFVCLLRLLYHICLRCLPSSRIHALSGARHWSLAARALFKAVLNLYRHNWKTWL